MSGIATAVIGSAVIGGVVASRSASKAAGAQSEAAAASDATQRNQYATTRADNAPFLANGTAASNALAYRLGLSSSPNGSAQKTLTASDLIVRDAGDWQPNLELYNSDASYKRAYDSFDAAHRAKYGVAPNDMRGSDPGILTNDLMSRGFNLEAANKAREEKNRAGMADQSGDHGSLLRNFTMADRDADPVYQSGLQFGLDEGVKGVNRLAAASGSMLSGVTLKALTRYGSDYGTTKAAESRNRFVADRDAVYNKLAGAAGQGQVASAQVGAAGQNMANTISQNQIGVGNARGASAIAQGNALTGAIGQGWSMYQGNQLMNMLGSNRYSGGQVGGYSDEMARINGQVTRGEW